jgi:hypothetical protein
VLFGGLVIMAAVLLDLALSASSPSKPFEDD